MSSPQTREAKLADDYLTSATLAVQVAHRGLMETMKGFENGTIRDPAKAAVSAATAGAIMLDKRLILEGRPTQIHATEDPVQAGLALLKRHGITIDSTATEIQDATLVQTTGKPPVQTNAETNETTTRTPLLPESVAANRAQPGN